MPSRDRAPLGDEAQLFASFNPTLLYVIGRDVRTSSHVVEDACAFAWMQFLQHQPDRRREWKSWLIVTARREAWRLSRERNRTMAQRPAEDQAVRDVADSRDPYDEAVTLRAIFDVLEQLPPRLRRIAFLRGAGLRYSDIAEITGDSLSRVDVLVTRANDRIRQTLEAERDQNRDLPPRARRLRELEDAPPSWLVAEIGPIPRSKGRRESNATRTLFWRRAALAIDDYRAMTGFDDERRGLGERPAAGPAQRAFDVAARAVDAVNARRRHSREIA